METKGLALYKLDFKVGRREPNLTGLFIADYKKVEFLMKHHLVIKFGEVAGKHSDVRGCIDPGEITLISDDTIVLKVVQDFNLETGCNPMHYPIAYYLHDLPEEVFCDLTINEALDILMKDDTYKIQ